jgi:NlpC/P60 family putative phage cell wall peptidase
VGPEPFRIPPYSRDWGEAGPREVLADGARAAMIETAPDEADPGAPLLFRMRAGAIAKHVGIVMPENRFVHAYERLGVIEEELTPTWHRRIAFAFLFPRMRASFDKSRQQRWALPDQPRSSRTLAAVRVP